MKYNLAEGPAKLAFWRQFIPVELSHSEIETGMVYWNGQEWILEECIYSNLQLAGLRKKKCQKCHTIIFVTTVNSVLTHTFWWTLMGFHGVWVPREVA